MLAIGDTFASFLAVENAVKAFEQEQGISYWRRDSRTIAAAKKRLTSLVDNPVLKYYEIKYTCVKGGRKYKPHSTGERPNQSTFRESCEAYIQFRAKDDNLVLVQMSIEHNHLLDKESFKFLPKSRRLNTKERAEVQMLLSTRPNKIVLQNHIISSTGKNVTVRDISNEMQKMTTKPGSLEEILNKLNSAGDKTIQVVASEDDFTLQAIYYQDTNMKSIYEYYPELMLVDATCKLNELQMSVFLQLVVDGNGLSEIVSVYVVVTEDAATIKKMVEIFQDNNPAWSRTKTIMTDKDMVERSVYGEMFPDAQLQLCHFHILQSIRREINTEKMGIRAEQKDRCLKIIQKIAYSANQTEYEENVNMLRDTGVLPVVQYMKKNWHDIREQWVIGLKKSCHFNNQTNNRLEYINQKLKQIIGKFSNLKTFFDDLEMILKCLRQERDKKIADVLMKRPCLSLNEDSAVVRFSKLVTPHALQLIKPQLHSVKKVQFFDEITADGSVQLQTSSGEVTVTRTHCNCTFTLMNVLPCRHVFALRTRLGLDTYYEEAVGERWLISLYREASARPRVQIPAGEENKDVIVNTEIPVDTVPRPQVLSQSQKYQVAFLEAQKLATLMSEVGMSKFRQRLDVIKNLAKHWSENEEVLLYGTLDDVNVVGEPAAVTGDDETMDYPEVHVIVTEEQPMVQKDPRVQQLEELEVIASSIRKYELDKSSGDETTELVQKVNHMKQPLSQLHQVVDLVDVSGTKLTIPLSTIEIKNQPLPSTSICTLSNVRMPPKMKKRGRPKGVHSTKNK